MRKHVVSLLLLLVGFAVGQVGPKQQRSNNRVSVGSSQTPAPAGRWSYERSPSPVKNDPRVLPDCSSSFNKAPQCIDSPTGYRCKCPSGFAWNTKACVAEASDTAFTFNQIQSRNEASAVISSITRSFPQLSEMTLVAWVRLDRSSQCGTLISYRVSHRLQDTLPFRILVCYNHIAVELFDNQTHIYIPVNPGVTSHWFHFGFIWRDTEALVYINGVIAPPRRNQPMRSRNAPKLFIPGKGDFVLGQTWNVAKLGANEVTVQNFDVQEEDPRTAFKKPVKTSEILSLTNGTSQSTEFVTRFGFNGDIAMLNIWNYTGRDLNISDIYNDCTFMHCGSVIEWTDWRNGMANLTTKWPSGIRHLHGKCFNENDLVQTCDKYCSALNGTKCTLEVVNNIVWPRVPINSIVETLCPASQYIDVATVAANERYKPNANVTLAGCVAFDRMCVSQRACDLVPGENYVARWAAPASDACLSTEHSDLRQSLLRLSHTIRASNVSTASNLIAAAFQRFSNLSSMFIYRSPIDLETYVNSLDSLVTTQSELLDRMCAELEAGYPKDYDRALANQLSFNHTSAIFRSVMTAMNNLLHSRNEPAWNATRPPGSVGVQLMQSLEKFYMLIARTLIYHFRAGNPTSRELQLTFAYEHVMCKVHSFTEREFHGVTFPDKVDDQTLRTKPARTTDSMQPKAPGAGQEAGEQTEKPKVKTPVGHEEAEESLEVTGYWPAAPGGSPSISTRGSVELSKAALTFLNRTNKVTHYIVVSCAYPKMFNVLPNHNWYTKIQRVQMEDNLNSVVYHIKAYAAHDNAPLNVSDIQTINQREPVKAYLLFKNISNISNPECVHLPLGKLRSTEQYVGRWSNRYCKMISNDSKHAFCGCSQLGLLAVTTDMYDDSWREPIVWPVYVTIPSYIGCCVSILSCFSAFAMLVYLKTSTKTASIHKNFALAIAFGQLSFMIGVERYNNDTVCLIFAILLHYFFLCTFAWIMNEALNLYIVITYAAHAHGAEPAESASFWRYYVFGWILPAVVVGAAYGSHQNDYLPNTGRVQDKVCWISWDLKWFFIGPAIGIISIATVVLVFTAKEHHESSYTKDEKSNRAIIIHSKALWTQAILLTMSWAFAILTLKMKSYILTLLFSMFNFLQGIFFLVFYFLLNAEVQYIYTSQSFKGATMLLGGSDAQAASETAQAANMSVRNSVGQISTHATRRLTLSNNEQTGVFDKLKQFAAKNGKGGDSPDADEKKEREGDLACRGKRTSTGRAIGGKLEEIGEEPLLKAREKNASSIATDIPLIASDCAAVSGDQTLSPATSWTTDLIVTSV